MVGIKIKNEVFPLPEKWEELTPTQYLIVFEELVSEVSEDIKATRIFMRVSGVKPILFLGWKRYVVAIWRSWWKGDRSLFYMPIFSALQVADEVLPVLKFVFERKVISKNLLPVITVKGWEYYGPSDGLLNVTNDEFEKCEFFYALYRNTKEDKWLQYLCGCLYRVAGNGDGKTSGDLRARFNENLVEDYFAAAGNFTASVMFAVLFFYEGCKEKMYAKYEGSGVFTAEEGKQVKLDPEAYRKVLFALAGEKNGTVDVIKKLTVHETFFRINELEEAYEKSKSK
jgi:hypothetical protein